MGGEEAATGDRSAPTVRIRLIATTDLHVHLRPYDYYNDRPRPATGLAQAAHLIRRLRAEAPPGAALLLDNGDFLTGGLLIDLVAQERMATRGGLHPMVEAMNALGYDAGTIGNHEFDHGIEALRAALAGAAFPLVSANLVPAGGARLGPPWTILRRDLPGSDGARHPVAIGVIGLGPPQVADWSAMALRGALRARDIIEAAAEEVPRLRAAGADLVVALCHSGLGPEAHEPGMEHAAIPLAALPGIDALVLGHSHATFPDRSQRAAPPVDPRRGTIHGKPAVQPGFFGSHVGVIDLWARRGAEGWRVAAHAARAEPVPRTAPEDEGLAPSLAPVHDRLLALAGRPLGETRVRLHSYFALLGQDRGLDVVADAKRAEARRLLAGRPEAAMPILCTVAPFRAGGIAGPSHYVDIAPGPVALRQAADLYIHPNTLCLLEITGAALRDWLERSASLFLRLARGRADQPLLDPAFPSYNFDAIDGLTWTIDPSRPARTDAEGRLIDPGSSRVGALRHEGRPVADGDRFVLATNSYRLGTGGRFDAARHARLILKSPVPTQEVVLSHVRSGPLDPAPRARWRFAPLPGTSALVDTGPGAARLGPEMAALGLERVGETPEGFLRLRLRL